MPPAEHGAYASRPRTVYNVHGAQMLVVFPGTHSGGKKQDAGLTRTDLNVSTYDQVMYGPPTKGAIVKHQAMMTVLCRGWQQGKVYTSPLAAGEESWALIACLEIEVGKPSRFVAVSRSVEMELYETIAACIQNNTKKRCVSPAKAVRKHFLSWGSSTRTSVGRKGPSPMMCISWNEMTFNKNNPSVWSSMSGVGSCICRKQRPRLHLVCADNNPVTEVTKPPTDVLAPPCDKTTLADPAFQFVRCSFPQMTREQRAVCYFTAPDNYCDVERQWVRDTREARENGAAPLLALAGGAAAPLAPAAPAGAAAAPAAVPGAREEVVNEPMCWHNRPAPPTLTRFCERCKAKSAAAEIGSLSGSKRRIADDDVSASEQIARMASLLDACEMAVRMPV